MPWVIIEDKTYNKSKRPSIVSDPILLKNLNIRKIIIIINCEIYYTNNLPAIYLQNFFKSNIYTDRSTLFLKRKWMKNPLAI